ncbi:DUF488 domain-containing protein [Maioricimonas sp. JC845]|uniref:DUF488 domain-containing protein n=1 Tax=Maioricimonas sp. JC845 TaxID=3232138 RepID=UPI0034589E3E
MSKQTLWTIGHSTRDLDGFLGLLQANGVTAVADVRSHPYSKLVPHFDRETLAASLKACDISYVFLGEELGARREEDCCYVDGRAEYDLIRRTPAFQAGLQRVRKGMHRYDIALMCAERDPLTCHRSILIARSLCGEFDVRHIVDSGVVESQGEVERRLLRIWGLEGRSLFGDDAELLDEAYQRQAREIAYVRPEAGTPGDGAG